MDPALLKKLGFVKQLKAAYVNLGRKLDFRDKRQIQAVNETCLKFDEDNDVSMKEFKSSEGKETVSCTIQNKAQEEGTVSIRTMSFAVSRAISLKKFNSAEEKAAITVEDNWYEDEKTVDSKQQLITIEVKEGMSSNQQKIAEEETSVFIKTVSSTEKKKADSVENIRYVEMNQDEISIEALTSGKESAASPDEQQNANSVDKVIAADGQALASVASVSSLENRVISLEELSLATEKNTVSDVEATSLKYVEEYAKTLKISKSRWFCNRPLSPEANTLSRSNSDKIIVHQDIRIIPRHEQSYPEDYEDMTPQSEFYDSDKDPEYFPETPENKFSEYDSPLMDEDSTEIPSTSPITLNQDLSLIEECASSSLDERILNPSSENNLSNQKLTRNRKQNLSPRKQCVNSSVDKRILNSSPETTSANQKLKRIRERDFCFYCEELVLNFSRHIQRKHGTELDVQRALAKPVKSKERKELLTLMRKKGNYLKNSEKCTKPMKKPNIKDTNFLPCVHCLGYYSAKQLWRHRKKCFEQTTGKGTRVQTDAHNHLVCHLRIDQQLRETVFPHMRADRISLVAKKDPLICAFAARYMKIHREKHFVNVTSRKMRELSRILIELKKLQPTIKDLFDALQPQYFDLFVDATKSVAQYDSEKDYYKSPTYAMNISTSLKQCCDIAITYALKKKGYYATIPTAEAEAKLKTMIRLFESNWKFEISSQAADDLNMHRWNKVTIVPLASDLKLLKEYLVVKAKSAVDDLTSNRENPLAYTQLLETVYCRVLLLNRRRPGELQRLPLRLYVGSDGNNRNNYEEIEEIVSPAEKVLMQSFKRIVIKGKWKHGVPVLFSVDVQEHIQVLLDMRDNFIKKDNPFLFARPNFDTPICGYKVIEKYALNSGAKNPKAITATRLRKHLATLTQVLSMSKNDIEQLSTFMGHTPGVHRKAYRLPDDIYQTAKISKLLLLMEKGVAAQYKGKALDDINLEMDEDLLTNTTADDDKAIELDITHALDQPGFSVYDHDQDNDAPGPSGIKNQHGSTSNDTILSQNSRIKKGKQRTLVPWRPEQKKIVEHFFSSHIRRKVPPKRGECEALKAEHPQVLDNKDWLKIKVYVQNKYTKI